MRTQISVRKILIIRFIINTKNVLTKFNGKNEYKEVTSNIQDVCALQHPPLLWTYSQMEKIVREDQHKD